MMSMAVNNRATIMGCWVGRVINLFLSRCKKGTIFSVLPALCRSCHDQPHKRAVVGSRRRNALVRLVVLAWSALLNADYNGNHIFGKRARREETRPSLQICWG